jgi:predicted DNA-binding transcriptional regulator AlpA
MSTTEVDVRDLPALPTYKQTASWASCTERHLQNLVKAEQFPSPIYVGKRSPRFRRSDLLEFLENQAGATPVVE